MNFQIGFETYDSHGPGIFLSRLKGELEALRCFDGTDPQVWIQLSFKPLPDWIRERQAAGKTKVIVRMDGASCWRWHYIRKPVIIPLPFVDTWYSRKQNAKKNAVIKRNLLQADGIIFQGEFSRQITHRFVTPTEPGFIVMNGIDLTAFSPQGEKIESARPDCVEILMSHSFRPSHRLHDALRIIACLKQQSSRNYFLNIVGGDEDDVFANARWVAQTMALVEGEDYKFWGKHPHQQLAAIYRSCDLMLNLSFWDACPNVAIEALASGLPIVGTGHGGLAEVVGEDGGILVPEHISFRMFDRWNVKTLPKAPIADYVKAIESLVAHREDYTRKARNRAERCFDIQEIARQYLHAAQLTAQAKQPATIQP